jgi:hypothetical protein
MSVELQLTLVAIAIAAAVGVEVAANAQLPSALGDGVAGGALLVSGAVALGVSRGRRSGALMIGTGAAWLAGTLSGGLVFVHRGPLVQLVLAYPRLWPAPWPVVAVVIAAYACALSTSAARSADVTLVLVAGVLATAAVRYRGSHGVERRARGAALAGTALIAAALTVAAIGRLSGGSLDNFSLWTYDTAIALAAVGFAADLRWGRWERAAVSELVADLGELAQPGALRDRLARTLSDPDIDLGFAHAGGYHDEFGRPLDLAADAGRTVSYAEDRGRRVAVLVHDAALLQDRRLLGAALSAARLAAGNERMLGEVRDGVAQLEASRRRLVEAAIEQRRGLEEELRTGAEHRLERVADRLLEIGAGGALTELIESVERVREDVRRFAQGIHPAVLTEHGLRPALEDSAALMPFEVAVEVPDERLPASVEVTVYFLCAEALANIAKHAGAFRVQINVRRTEAGIDATVADDGGGGADLMAGTGLRGLRDRIAALGGTLTVDSPPGVGTTLHARIPI